MSTSHGVCRTPSQEDYWERVAKYEPWALADDEDLASLPPAPPSVLDHMRRQ